MFGVNCVEPVAGSVSRRQLLRVGALSFAGIGLPELLRLRQLQAQERGGPARAKSCILIYLFGGPSQLETFDLKPLAPVDFRGEFRPIATNVPGISISEHLPLLARQADKYAIIRSMTHEHPRHGWGLYHDIRSSDNSNEKVASRRSPISNSTVFLA